MNPIPIPRDFAQRVAVMTENDLRRHYKRSGYTIKRWCRIAGVEPVRVRTPLKREVVFHSADTPEQIRMCLNCTLPDCSGWCAKMAEAKSG